MVDAATWRARLSDLQPLMRLSHGLKERRRCGSFTSGFWRDSNPPKLLWYSHTPRMCLSQAYACLSRNARKSLILRLPSGSEVVWELAYTTTERTRSQPSKRVDSLFYMSILMRTS